ncbi:primosomal protein N' [Enterococcus columbae]|uniref:Replication restart protein PriA n=1 Tax=Enterococcus columbae DSM 7374 = ATCC 51263 TaxID=1121865 RepID=S1N2Z6_9ENTE|nr:primosomal protein N' [Enterococcus columbae]EOT39079.1 primosomal protein N' [Enterococcus columbae DSM 7374 = ATCC 51263]EOW79988.1 primosomal protein N' [Enterococcus columbae DSM 7374 = ATCC 51263]
MYELAEVIVDVPTMQTDQPFTYLIPDSLRKVIAIGMRVEVPFGNGNRHVQGFVVGLKTSTSQQMDSLDLVSLKSIVRCLDLQPVLNQELLAIADYMQEVTYAFKITCLQTMLPALLKANYDKEFHLLDETHPIKAQFFKDRSVIDWQSVEQAQALKQFKELQAAGVVRLEYQVKTKNQVKTLRYVKPSLTSEEYQALQAVQKKSALRKIQLLQLLSEQKVHPVSFYKEQGISTAHLNQGMDLGWLSFEEVEIYRDPYAAYEFTPTQAMQLNVQQQAACQEILQANQNQQSQVFLLEGITGSGKTEVYLQVIEQVLAKGQTAMMLVPEIALTPQMVERFKARFSDRVAVLHSGLSQGEKYDEWRKIEREEAQVVVGARSAVFAPLKNIGVIVIDEEHEASYKQDETPRYHARDIAIWRGKYHQCPVILGSATPSLESRARAQKKLYRLLTLTKRANPLAQLPKVSIVDMRQEANNSATQTFSQVLQDKIHERLNKHEQIVLLLNRRGYSSFVMCRDCGYVLPCPNCDISLTLHMDVKRMRCHYCGHEEPIPRRCPSCGQDKIRYYGTGTQKVEEEAQQLFPEAKIIRMDVDTTRKKGAHERLLKAFGEKKADILLGTQMIAKGLDFPDITLVGVLNADTSLNLPDFRSSERTFQLLTQVSGRAGRADKPGKVIIQTFNPTHHAITLAQSQDYEAFYQQEMFIRHQSDYPPYYFTVKLTFSHEQEQKAAQKAFAVFQQLKQNLSPQSIFLGPTPSAIMRVKNRYYYQIVIKYKREPQLARVLREIVYNSQLEQRQGLFVSVDYEPLQFI